MPSKTCCVKTICTSGYAIKADVAALGSTVRVCFFFMNIPVLFIKKKRTNTDTLEDLSHLAQRPLKNKEITIRSKNPVLPKITRRLHQPPLSPAAVVKEDTMATPEPKEPIASKL